MGVNKVIYYGETIVDMSKVTVSPETLSKGKTALDASGELITGTLEMESVPICPYGSITADEWGNVEIDSFHAYTFTDDGEGNLVGHIAEAMGAVDEGNDGNVSFS